MEIVNAREPGVTTNVSPGRGALGLVECPDVLLHQRDPTDLSSARGNPTLKLVAHPRRTAPSTRTQ